MNLELQLRKEVGHGGMVPRGWQMAWYEPRRRVGVYYPAPLHWIVRAMREFAYGLRLALRAPGIEGAQFLAMQQAHRERQRMTDEYARGYMAGWHECFQACVDAIEGEMSRSDEAWEIGTLLVDGNNPRREN
jgi:hypothetical protein